MAEYNILVINPGSTSDAVSYFRGEKEVFHKTVRYSPEELKPYELEKVTHQIDMRTRIVLAELEKNHIDLKEIQAVIGRGGLTRPIESGVYAVDDQMIKDLYEGAYGDHPCNLGGIIARSIAKMIGVKSYIADPGVVDERDILAKYSGMPELPRVSIFHALNQKRVARHACRQLGKPYEDSRLIIMHAGGGVSVGAHRDGRVIDNNEALDGDGPFTPQRSGGVPSGRLVKMCYSGKYTMGEMLLKIKGRGGLVAYTGTSDCQALEKYIATGEVVPGCGIDPAKVSREKAKEAMMAMIYQMVKEIGAMAAVLDGKVDAVILTGGLAHDKIFTDEVKRRVSWIAPVLVYPGGDEMAALRVQAEAALSHPKTVKVY